MLILLGFAFLSGIITIAAPCIWPILPIVFSASASHGGKRRPLGITLGLVVSFSALTLGLSYALRAFAIDPDAIRWFAVVVIGLLGVVLLIPKLSAQLEGVVSRWQGRLLKRRTLTKGSAVTAPGSSVESSGWWGGFMTGLALGVIWTPCAGPILATIATLASTQAVDIVVVLLTLVYTLGVAVPLFILALLGQRLFRAMRRLNKYTGIIQQVFGGVMIVAAVMIGFGYDRTLQAKLLDAFPGYANFVVDLESNETVEQQLNILRDPSSNGIGIFERMPTDTTADNDAEANLPDYGAAPELGGINAWLNTENNTGLTLDDLKGKVVLIDFWTYTCINCIRTLPYVQSWHEQYAADGLVIIGVHTPEFVFEQDVNNVAAAMTDYGLTYPVALDNDYVTWRNFSNHYWPAKYLIDANGHVRYYHFGEGEYEATEAAIQELLAEAGNLVDTSTNLVDVTAYDPLQTPETYLGTARADLFAHSDALQNGQHHFTHEQSNVEDLQLHHWTITGDWELTEEAALPGNNADLTINYQASDVYVVITPELEVDSAAGAITILLDGAPISSSAAGADVVDGRLQLDQARLYHLVHTENLAEHVLTLQFDYANVELYAFTFGAPASEIN